MEVHKYITGYVKQIFQDGKCISQEFIASDDTEYETPEGDSIDPQLDEEELELYYPCDMVEPNSN